MSNRRLCIAIGLLLSVGVAFAVWRARDQPLVATSSPGTHNDSAMANAVAFHDVTQAVGLDFQRTPARRDGFYFPDIMSAGAALFDFDCDGDLDIYLTDGRQLAGNGTPASAERDRADKVEADGQQAGPRNRLYEQQADGKFVDVTARSGLGDREYGSGVAIGDANNDGFPDVYVSNVGPDRLYLNQRDGTFVDVTAAAGIDNLRWGTSVAFVDFDRDGWLDIFVANYVDYHPARRCKRNGRQEDFCHPGQFSPTADKLYRNTTGDGVRKVTGDAVRSIRFEDVSLKSGIATQPGPGLGVYAADFNADGWPDVYVANDCKGNVLWVNQHDGTFQDEAVIRGLATDNQGRSQSSMGIAFGDIDADQHPDVLLTHYRSEPNTLYVNRPPFGFEDRSAAAGLLESTFNSTGFGVVFCDLDHDGDLDAAVANGHVMRQQSRLGNAAIEEEHVTGRPNWRDYAEPNQVFLNDGTGRLTLVPAPSCPFRSVADVSRGLAAGDVDGDGDIDFLVANIAGPARLLLNDSPKRGNWLIVRAVEPSLGGRDAYGAVVTVTANDRRWSRVVNSTSSYLSSDDPRVHFGVAAATRFDKIEVQWPNGDRESFPGAATNRVVVVSHGKGAKL